jgi:hypothetical protein
MQRLELLDEYVGTARQRRHAASVWHQELDGVPVKV